ncbi:hypothetical protein TcG_04898 [Trypanosoma cruzi]|uniref:Uncharacterized protein n=1 Tax=Trypanosoma cruzi Dm28c TaxID=1416333 RepID=V5BHC7_TRYCR|nr:hypothetical protein TCDM_04201 [Trypanosoma cruzi Dm28c]RNF18765.1 hypothetical protein TcG_04898 [Trypanosoma cruzi]
MNIYGRDQRAYNLHRTRGEGWLLHVHTLTIGVQLACLLFAIFRTSNAASATMANNFFVTSVLDLDDFYLLDGCSVLVNRSRTVFSKVSYSLSTENVGYFISRSATNIRLLFTCAFLNFVVCTINRLWLWMTLQELRHHFVVIRHDLFIAWELCLIIICIVLLKHVEEENKSLRFYLLKCTRRQANNFTTVTSYIELRVSFYMTLALFLLNALVAIFVRLKNNPGKRILNHEATQLETPYNHASEGPGMQQQQQRFQSYDLSPPGVRHGEGEGTKISGNEVVLGTTAAHVGPLEHVEKRHFSPSFGPSVSRPMTPSTTTPDPGTLQNREDGAMSAPENSWRSPGDGVHALAHPSWEASLTRFQPPPPPPSLGRMRAAQGDAATEETVELEHRR